VVEHLRTLVLAEWEQFKQCAGDGDSSPKDRLRQKYRANRLEILRRDRSWIAFNACKLLDWFASGSEVVPEKIAPRLVRVETEAQQALFRLARYTWSLPYSKGYGRRLKFLILDAHNSRLMGLLGLQSPALDFSPRDRKFTCAPGRKVQLVDRMILSTVLANSLYHYNERHSA
jgi:hypothetical protein